MTDIERLAAEQKRRTQWQQTPLEMVDEDYRDMDTGLIEQLLEIFRRVNRIDEKEQKQKNLQTARKA